MDLNEKIIEETKLVDGLFLKMNRIKVELPDGNIGYRDVLRHPGAVCVLAFKEDDSLLLVKQFRTPIEKALLEVPAGKLEKGEDLEVAVKRELEEETGYKSDNITYLGKIVTAPGFTDEVIHIFKATDLYEGTVGGDEDEFIETYEFKISDIKKMIRNGEIIDAKTICAISHIL